MAASLLFVSAPSSHGAHLVSQTIQLQPGWNAVYLEVEPVVRDTLSVFRDVPIASVWTYVRKGEPTEFFQNMTEDLHQDPHWLVFFPTNRHERMFNDLFAVSANRAYFIKLASSNAFTWMVTGRPAVARPGWDANALNLVGFPLDPAAALPTVSDFFAPSPALAGQAVYRLSAAGAWELVANPSIEVMRAGECQWVYANGEAGHMGPLNVTVTEGDGLDYGATLTELSVYLENIADVPMSVNLRDVQGANGYVSRWTFDTNTLTVVWEDLPNPLTLSVPTGAVTRVRLGVRREEFPDESYETTIEVTGDLGTRVLVPLTVRK